MISIHCMYHIILGYILPIHSLNGMKFSTKHSDNDQWSSSCAHNFMAMHDGLTLDNISKSCLSQ